MEDPLILEFVNREDLPSAITSRDAALSTDASITRKSTTLRDACVALLRSIRSDTLQTGLAGQLETIAPQLERHITLQQKVQKWLLADEFDAIGACVVFHWLCAALISQELSSSTSRPASAVQIKP